MTDQLAKKSAAWSGRFSEPVSELVKRYTASVDFDFEGPLSNTVSIATTASEATTSNNHSAAALDVAWNRVYLPAVLRDTLGR